MSVDLDELCTTILERAGWASLEELVALAEGYRRQQQGLEEALELLHEFRDLSNELAATVARLQGDVVALLAELDRRRPEPARLAFGSETDR